ncbi:MAG: helix-turn-helix domain-containing protein [Proteobacteria bacterium]|nr:helix-turn-helix domain-containing protein [Pseudomonadota bacterium]
MTHETSHAALAHIAVQQCGGASALARILDKQPSVISQWLSGYRPIPVSVSAEIERATHGAVTRKDLRPHDWATIWPELAEQERS